MVYSATRSLSSSLSRLRWDGAKSTRSAYLKKAEILVRFCCVGYRVAQSGSATGKSVIFVSCQEPRKLLKYGNELFCPPPPDKFHPFWKVLAISFQLQINVDSISEISSESPGNDWVGLSNCRGKIWSTQLFLESAKIVEWLGRLYSTYLNCTRIS